MLLASGSPACRGRAGARQDTGDQRPLAEAIGGDFKRIQFTPDLVPADLDRHSGIYNQQNG